MKSSYIYVSKMQNWFTDSMYLLIGTINRQVRTYVEKQNYYRYRFLKAEIMVMKIIKTGQHRYKQTVAI
jgi:hypothetical protein